MRGKDFSWTDPLLVVGSSLPAAGQPASLWAGQVPQGLCVDQIAAPHKQKMQGTHTKKAAMRHFRNSRLRKCGFNRNNIALPIGASL
jgi:hypothetical protein